MSVPDVNRSSVHHESVDSPTVAIHGLGYIGLPTAAILALSGLNVVGIDLDPDVVSLVNAGKVRHKDEAGLDALIAELVPSGRLRAAVSPVSADVHIIAVGTPVAVDKSPDLSAVEGAARSVAKVLRPGDLVIVESTVPPLTCEGLVGSVIREETGLDHRSDYLLAHCPERVIPGNLLRELVENDRIVGGTTERATRAASALYARFVTGQVIETDARTAETTKLMENTYRDVNIALANELAELAAHVGVNIDTAIRLANRHPRVNLHSPGIGVGGHCIPVDPWFLVAIRPDRSRLLSTARKVNDSLPHKVADAIRKQLMDAGVAHVTLLGLSYKPNVDDLRESPSVEIALLLSEDATLQVDVVEPHVDRLPAELERRPNVQRKALSEVNGDTGPVVKLTAHREFEGLERRGIVVKDAREIYYRSVTSTATRPSSELVTSARAAHLPVTEKPHERAIPEEASARGP